MKLHRGYELCQHCGMSTTECKKCFGQIGERCCRECETERTKIYEPKKAREKARDTKGRRNRKFRYVMNYKEVEALVDEAEFERIRQAWDKVKTPVTGYIDYRTVAKLLKMPVGKLMMYLKGSNVKHNNIVFNIDRMGCNVFFKFIKH